MTYSYSLLYVSAPPISGCDIRSRKGSPGAEFTTRKLAELRFLSAQVSAPGQEILIFPGMFTLRDAQSIAPAAPHLVTSPNIIYCTYIALGKNGVVCRILTDWYLENSVGVGTRWTVYLQFRSARHNWNASLSGQGCIDNKINLQNCVDPFERMVQQLVTNRRTVSLSSFGIPRE